MKNIHELLQRIDNLRRAVHQGVHAPHKPLLILYALGRYLEGQKEIPYRQAGPEMTKLLREFGPARKSYRPEDPFWRLQNDGLWTVTAEVDLGKQKHHGGLQKSLLCEHNAVGRFTSDVDRILSESPAHIWMAVRRLLEAYFPSILHEDIQAAVGLLSGGGEPTKRRSTEFRHRVLRAYRYRCCVCGYDLRMGERLVGLEAAHIMWQEVGGPDIETNGLALCALHHKLFVSGVFTIRHHHPNSTVLCSEELNGNGNLGWMLDYHGRPLNPPQRRAYSPEKAYVNWHQKMVFKGPAMQRRFQ